VSAELPRLGLAHIPKFRVERHGFLEVPVVFHGPGCCLGATKFKEKAAFRLRCSDRMVYDATRKCGADCIKRNMDWSVNWGHFCPAYEKEGVFTFLHAAK
jgi:hypothetical protein